MSYPRWDAARSYLLDNFISVVIKEPGLQASMLDATRAPLWQAALTDPTIIGQSNYERLEKLGDARLEAGLIEILLAQFPEAEPGDLNGMITYYRSNEVFADIVDTFLPVIPSQFFRIISGVGVSNSVKADIFEALFGAYYLAAESVVRGLGDIFVRETFEHFLKQWLVKEQGSYSFDLSLRFGSPSTQFENIFKKMPGRRKTEVRISDDRKTVTVTVYITREQITYINSKLLPGQRPLPMPLGGGDAHVFSSTAISKEAASRRAHTDALSFLNEKGVDMEWAAKIKSARVLQGLEASLATRLSLKSKQAGYVELRFNKISKHTIEGQQTVVILKGRKSGSVFFRDLAVGVGSIINAPTEAVRNYVQATPEAAVTSASFSGAASSSTVVAPVLPSDFDLDFD